MDVAGSDLADCDLEGAAVDDLVAVEFAQNVAALESGVAGRGIRRDLADDGSGGIRKIEEAGVVGSDIVHADAQIAVMHRAGLDDGFGRGLGDLRGNGEACAGEGAVVGDDEGVDADQLAMRIDQRSAGVAGVDGGVGLDEVAGLARIVGIRIGAIEGADDAARDRELEVAEGAAEGEHGLAGMEPGGVAPGDAGQVFRVDLDDREIVELVDADEFGREDAAVIQGDANLHGAIDDVIVGDDVAVGRNDDAAADAVLDLAARASCAGLGLAGPGGRRTTGIQAAMRLAGMP